jgi:hypothetical protein
LNEGSDMILFLVWKPPPFDTKTNFLYRNPPFDTKNLRFCMKTSPFYTKNLFLYRKPFPFRYKKWFSNALKIWDYMTAPQTKMAILCTGTTLLFTTHTKIPDCLHNGSIWNWTILHDAHNCRLSAQRQRFRLVVCVAVYVLNEPVQTFNV